jgi:hypothetical protein
MIKIRGEPSGGIMETGMIVVVVAISHIKQEIRIQSPRNNNSNFYHTV